MPYPGLKYGVAEPTLPAAPATSVYRGAPVPATVTPPAPTIGSYAAPVLAGLQAGQAGLNAYDTKTGVASALGAAAAGGLAGATLGPAGAAVGAGAGLLLGGLNAWMSVGRENKANRDRRKLLAEAKSEQNRRDKIARDDAVDGLAFERKQISEQKRLDEWQRMRAVLDKNRAESSARDAQFVEKGYV